MTEALTKDGIKYIIAIVILSLLTLLVNTSGFLF